ncbi:MAG: dimethylarginine dimethylaminohydrolase family protein [Gemmatimonadales bacterium]
MAERRYGGQSEYGALRRVVVRPPGRAFGDADPTRWDYAGRPDLGRARDEHRALVALLEESGVEVLIHDGGLADHADAIYVYDPVLVTDQGAVPLRMGKPLRRGEEAALGELLERVGVPLLGGLTGDATAEAGDTLWLDSTTLAVGLGFRTNAAAVEQLRTLLGPAVTVLPVELPYFEGPDACLHLKSLISLLDADLAVVHLELLPVPFYQELRRRRIELIPIDPAEFRTQASNVLAVGPRDLVMLDGNPKSRGALERAGCRVRSYRGEEISLKAEGGPTCLTRPVWRA